MRFMLAVLMVVLGCLGVASGQPPETAPDEGDAPLPAGALARIGTTRLRHGGAIYQLVFSPNGRILASTGNDRLLRCWDLATGKQLWAGAVSDDPPVVMAFSPDGATLASSDRLTHICLWTVKTGKHQMLPIRQKVPPETTHAIAFSADGKRLSLLDVAYRVVTYEIASRELSITEIQERRNQESTWSALSADATFGAANGDLWRIDRGKMIGTLPGAAQIVAISPDGRHVASSANDDAESEIWEVAKPRFRQCAKVAAAYQFAFAPDGRTLAIAKAGGKHASEVLLLDLITGKRRHVLRQARTAIFRLAFSPDTRVLATGTAAGVIRLWDVATGKERLILDNGLAAAEAARADAVSKIYSLAANDAAGRWSVGS